ncbi:dihydroorotase [Archaeoglobus neptunius]|uniref:dihydroorotase n=1 Tax=Archaeoglobus neptunius TaxID=2798580 RepID=UPI0019274D4D|nr:dihydroorotase [Archaeoglobus neptunius]
MIRGKVFYRGEFIEAGIEVDGGRIKKIGKLVKGKEVRGVILPAGIDVHVHLRDFDEAHKETIETGTMAAKYGGICLVVDQPNTRPVVDSEKVYFERMEKAKSDVHVDYTLNLALTNSNFGEIAGILEKIRSRYFVPAVGEVFIQHSNDNLQIRYETLRLAISNLKNVLLTIHAEDPAYVDTGFPNFRFRKKEAEVFAVQKCLTISNFHFCHISTRDAAERICNSDSTFEVTPHHLLLSTDDYRRLGYAVNVNPPLRSRDEAEWLLKHFHMADILASDHAPHTLEDKKSGAPGFPGVETMYPIFVHLAAMRIIRFGDLVEKIASNPARIFGFRGYGEIRVGNYANFAVFDLKNVRKIRAEDLHSRCDWTPYEGFNAVFPDKVYLKGTDVLEVAEPTGEVLGAEFQNYKKSF